MGVRDRCNAQQENGDCVVRENAQKRDEKAQRLQAHKTREQKSLDGSCWSVQPHREEEEEAKERAPHKKSTARTNQNETGKGAGAGTGTDSPLLPALSSPLPLVYSRSSFGARRRLSHPPTYVRSVKTVVNTTIPQERRRCREEEKRRSGRCRRFPMVKSDDDGCTMDETWREWIRRDARSTLNLSFMSFEYTKTGVNGFFDADSSDW